ncbi:MAG: TetR/AcrR family transcriptional regulator [Bacteroidota bacterium]
MKKRKKHAENIRQQILEAAMQVYTDRGIEKTSIRNIVEIIGYSPAAVYFYFKNKAEIMFALHIKGFTELKRRFEVLHSVKNPLERLKAMGRAYIQFSFDYPALYDLMFVSEYPMKHLMEGNEPLWRQGEATFDELRQTVAGCIRQGYFPGHDVEALSFLIWSMVHGMVSLHNSGRSEKAQIATPQDIVMLSYGEFERMMDRL